MIVTKTSIRAHYERALILGASEGEAIRTVARALGQSEDTVRAVLAIKEEA